MADGLSLVLLVTFLVALLAADFAAKFLELPDQAVEPAFDVRRSAAAGLFLGGFVLKLALPFAFSLGPLPPEAFGLAKRRAAEFALGAESLAFLPVSAGLGLGLLLGLLQPGFHVFHLVLEPLQLGLQLFDVVAGRLLGRG